VLRRAPLTPPEPFHPKAWRLVNRFVDLRLYRVSSNQQLILLRAE